MLLCGVLYTVSALTAKHVPKEFDITGCELYKLYC
jgi:hypothetical protein